MYIASENKRYQPKNKSKLHCKLLSITRLCGWTSKQRITSRGIKRLAEEERRKLLEELRKTVQVREEWEERESLLRYGFWGWVLENADRIRGELEDPRLSSRYRLLLRTLELSVGVEELLQRAGWEAQEQGGEGDPPQGQARGEGLRPGLRLQNGQGAAEGRGRGGEAGPPGPLLLSPFIPPPPGR
jgi:hypothetical protein